MNVRLIHITAELPPTVGGVADYTAILSRRLVEVSDRTIEPVLVRAGKASNAPPEVDFEYVDQDGTYSAEALCATIEQLANQASGPAVVLLQYSGYGYAPRGAPIWLLRALQRACGENGVPLITIFHELYATGPPWTSAFWLSPVQRYVAAQLARLSSAVVTNCRSAVDWLTRFCGSNSKCVRVAHSFSNVGEPEKYPEQNSDGQAVVFGGGRRKKKIYSQHREALVSLYQRGVIQRLVDVGPEVESGLPFVDTRGTLPVAEVSRCLSGSSIGMVSYPGSRLGKSGSVAAMSAHGVPFILFDEEKGSRTGPYIEGDHFWRWSSIKEENYRLTTDRIAKASQSIFDLYQSDLHSNRNAKSVLGAIKSVLS